MYRVCKMFANPTKALGLWNPSIAFDWKFAYTDRNPYFLKEEGTHRSSVPENSMAEANSANLTDSCNFILQQTNGGFRSKLSESLFCENLAPDYYI